MIRDRGWEAETKADSRGRMQQPYFRRLSKVKWIIDTDPGIDDASAIITAVNSGALDILGITSVHGNVKLSTPPETRSNSLN